MRNPLPLLALVALAVAFAPIFGPSAAHAQGQGQAFLIAGNDGYGLQECLGEGGECGRAVADAWCAAEGRGAALSFGRADAKGDGGYVVTCGD